MLNSIFTAMLHKIIETTFLCDVIEFSKLNTYSDALSALRFLHPGSVRHGHSLFSIDEESKHKMDMDRRIR